MRACSPLCFSAGLGGERPRGQLHLWPRLCYRVLAKARPGPGLQSSPGEFNSAAMHNALIGCRLRFQGRRSGRERRQSSGLWRGLCVVVALGDMWVLQGVVIAMCHARLCTTLTCTAGVSLRGRIRNLGVCPGMCCAQMSWRDNGYTVVSGCGGRL